jgi:hypothetical protein
MSNEQNRKKLPPGYEASPNITSEGELMIWDPFGFVQHCDDEQEAIEISWMHYDNIRKVMVERTAP